MTSAQIVWTVLIAAQAVVAVPLILTAYTLLKGPCMTISAENQAIITELQTTNAALVEKLAAEDQAKTDAVNAAVAQAQTDAAETTAAFQVEADAIKATVGA